MKDELLLQSISEMMDKMMDQKLEPIHNTLDRMDVRLDRMDVRLDHMDEQMDRMEDRMDRIEGRMDRIEGRMDGVEGRLDRLESQVSALRVTQLEQGREIKEINSRVNDTYQLALEAWGLGTENRHWLELAQK
ncbi:MAG: hypothetical protein J6B43_05535 [Lachnospiraceae bacterium]|nr:hypothetical protein [Lachnospiraceae bacterium]